MSLSHQALAVVQACMEEPNGLLDLTRQKKSVPRRSLKVWPYARLDAWRTDTDNCTGKAIKDSVTALMTVPDASLSIVQPVNTALNGNILLTPL